MFFMAGVEWKLLGFGMLNLKIEVMTIYRLGFKPNRLILYGNLHGEEARSVSARVRALTDLSLQPLEG